MSLDYTATTEQFSLDQHLQTLLKIGQDLVNQGKPSLESIQALEKIPDTILWTEDRADVASLESVGETIKGGLKRLLEAIARVWRKITEWLSDLFTSSTAKAERAKQKAEDAARQAERDKYSAEAENWNNYRNNSNKVIEEYMKAHSSALTDAYIEKGDLFHALQSITTYYAHDVQSLLKRVQTLHQQLADNKPTVNEQILAAQSFAKDNTPALGRPLYMFYQAFAKVKKTQTTLEALTELRGELTRLKNQQPGKHLINGVRAGIFREGSFELAGGFFRKNGMELHKNLDSLEKVLRDLENLQTNGEVAQGAYHHIHQVIQTLQHDMQVIRAAGAIIRTLLEFENLISEQGRAGDQKARREAGVSPQES